MDDVGAADGVLVLAAAGDADLGEVAHAREHLLRRARLDAGAEDREHARVRPREKRVASAAAAAVRIAVMYVPSMSATGVPFAGSKSAITAWCVGRSRLPGKSVTSLQPEPGGRRVAGHRAEHARVAGEAATRGTSARCRRRAPRARPRARR